MVCCFVYQIVQLGESHTVVDYSVYSPTHNIVINPFQFSGNNYYADSLMNSDNISSVFHGATLV